MRRQNDFYETSRLAVNELVKRVSISGTIFECCSGMGAISHVLREEVRNQIITNDIDVTLPADYHFDASKRLEWLKRNIDWTVTNPPFSKAFEILVNAYDTSRVGVALLLRLSFLEPTYERQDWLAEHPPSRLIVLPRYSFTGDGKTDSVTCAWMVFSKRELWNNNAISICKKVK